MTSLPLRRCLLGLAGLLSIVASAIADESASRLTREEREPLLGSLRSTLTRETGWTQIRAAEALVGQGYPEEALRVLQPLSDTAPPEVRIGIWRVLAQSEPAPAKRRAFVARILEATRDPGGPDRLHAIESAAKLGAVIPESDWPSLQALAAANPPAAPFAQWLLAVAGQADARKTLVSLLQNEAPLIRFRAAYALARLPGGSPEETRSLVDAALAEPADSPFQAAFNGAALRVARDPVDRERLRRELLRAAKSENEEQRLQATNALADVATPADRPLLAELTHDSSPQIRLAAATAVLRVDRRIPTRMAAADWAMIVAYLVGMLAIGWYYSRQQQSRDEYLLGGRRMKSWTVGLSLFATMVSTISYLTWPGEVILNGPMVLCRLLPYPLIALIVGRFLIPFFMSLKVTSAYEILELRLGIGVRLLGSFFFLLLRLLWMSVIIYATTAKVIIPVMGLDPGWSPWVGLVLGITTLIYTSQGGLRAVVATDVVQSFILIGGAIVAMIVISSNLGGVRAWWPTEWAPHWEKPVLGYDPTARITLLSACIASFTWFICTAGSDQMAIQRYLATRDVHAARRMYWISLLVGAFLEVFLCILGFALLAYFLKHRELLDDGQTILNSADQLFPRFIVAGLPAGLTGLVVAGLLAAAMSSLSSGLSSSCSVILVDFIDRFRKPGPARGEHVRLAKFISAAIGAVVVLLSLLVGAVQGNLLELAFKIVNLLTAPLFGLFFMALFVPWATSFGTLVGAVVGVTTVVSINFWKELFGAPGPSFMWAMPTALVAQIAIGSLFSLLPIGTRRPPLVTAEEPSERR